MCKTVLDDLEKQRRKDKCEEPKRPKKGKKRNAFAADKKKT